MQTNFLFFYLVIILILFKNDSQTANELFSFWLKIQKSYIPIGKSGNHS